MPRPPAPCGTFSAYKRHKRKGEPIDDACAGAALEQSRVQHGAVAEEAATVTRMAISSAEPVVDEVDELTEARWNLAVVRATMESGAPGMAALSKQYVELVSLVKRLEALRAPEVSALDQLAQRRAERRAASAN